MKKYRQWLLIALGLNILALILYGLLLCDQMIPSDLYVKVGEEVVFDYGMPLTAKTTVEDQSVVNVNQEPLTKAELTLDLSTPFSLNLSETGSYKVDLKLLGFTLKQVEVKAINDVKLMPGGMPVGIYIKTNGIMALGTGKITSVTGEISEPAKGLIKSGDYICTLNGQAVESTEAMVSQLNQCQGDPVTLGVQRGGKPVEITINPVKTGIESYKIGLWIRDDTQGIGTLSFIDAKNRFGTLGHGITDVDTSLLIDTSRGNLYHANILSIVKGQNGVPGEMVGTITYAPEETIGKITKNCDSGIYGMITDPNLMYREEAAISIGLKQEIELGAAYMLCAIDGEVRPYKIQIEKIDMDSQNKNKDLVLEIVDEGLLSKTNGIIQGMSGSPIIQNGKLIAVITHVFLNDSTKGYGIFIENMLNNLDK